MGIKYKEMAKGTVLAAGATSIYQTPTLTSAAVHAASGNNPTTGAVVVNVYKGALADGTTKIVSKTVQAGKTVQFPELVNHKLEPGSQLFADGAGCSINISGIEYTPE